jgi:hypothetical protein
MAQQPPTIEFEDIPLHEARRMSRGPRMNPEFYNALKEKTNPWTPPPPACRSRTAHAQSRGKTASSASPRSSVFRSPSGASPEASSSGARLTKIAGRPKRSPHDCSPLGSHHKQSGAAAAGIYRAAHQHTTVTQREAIT